MGATVAERVEALDQAHFDEYAEFAKRQLAEWGHAHVVLTPGDGTRYEIVIVQMTVESGRPKGVGYRLEHADRYLMATNMGAMYEFVPGGYFTWDYVCDKWVADDREWTGRVLARFLNRLGEEWT